MKLTINPTGQLEASYNLTHTHGEDTLHTILTITRIAEGWVAEVTDNFKPVNNPEVAARKLGESLYRIAEAIMENEGKFGKIDLEEVEL